MPIPANTASRISSPEFDLMLPFRAEVVRAAGAFQAPYVECAGSKAVVHFEVRQRLGDFELLEITRRRAQHPLFRGQFLGDQRGIFQLADADRDIEVFPDDVDNVVGDPEIDVDFGVAVEEFGQVRRDVQSAEGGRRRYFQVSARPGITAVDEVLGFLDETENVDDPLVVTVAGFRQRKMPCRALEEAGAEAVFQQTDALRNDSRRQTHFAAGC